VDSDAEVAAARIGRVIGGRFRLERVLGIGGMAAVYQARDAAGHLHAVKLLHPEMAARREVRERFVREGSVSERIGHPGVVQAFPAGDGTDDAYLVMEMLQGETLRARVKRHGRLPLEEVLDYADQVLDALVAAHDKGIVHRDLKPDNLFVTSEGRIKILDFGLARLLDGVPGEHRTRTGVALGTLAYMAPEQALGRRAEIDGRVDVFALGATMFRILAGRRVHEAESEAELLMAMASRPAPPLATVAPGIPEPVCSVVDLSLAFSREARYPDARTMLADIRALRAGGLPPYATARFASRDEATRADGLAPSVRTQPLGATMAPSQRGATVPLAAYRPSGAAGLAPGPSVPAGAPVVPAVDTAPMSTRGNTAPMAVTFAPGAAPAPAAAMAPVVSSSPPAVSAPPKSNAGRGLLVLVGALALALGLGGALWFLRGGEGAEATGRPLPAPEPSAEGVTRPATVPTSNAVVSPVTSPTAPAETPNPRPPATAAKPASADKAASTASTAPAVPTASSPSATGSAAPSPAAATPAATATQAVPSPPAAAAPDAPAPAPPKRFKGAKGKRGGDAPE
jgi:eukaryotic-like serine/threonine-protein kinase